MAKVTTMRNRRSKSGRTGKAMTAPRRNAARSNGGGLTSTFGQRKQRSADLLFKVDKKLSACPGWRKPSGLRFSSPHDHSY